jgi:hypothetical protein
VPKVIKMTMRRMTPELLEELLRIHMSCVHDQEGRCPLLISMRSLCWEINQVMGCANEEDRGFHRHNEMLAARPLICDFDKERD